MKTPEERIDAVLMAQLKTERPPTSRDHLVEDLALDSMRLVELLGRLEDEFDIIIPINGVTCIQTVADLHEVARNPESLGITADTGNA